jgi:c-di-GMP phosphodiesterase
MLLILCLSVGLMLDVIWVKNNINQTTKDTIESLDIAIGSYLDDIKADLTVIDSNTIPCDKKNRKGLEQLNFDSPIIQEITYIENNTFLCSDRIRKSNIKIESSHLNKFEQHNGYVIYRAKSQRRHIDALFFMVPTPKGWYRIMLDGRYIDFWIKQYTNKNQLSGCLGNKDDSSTCLNLSSQSKDFIFEEQIRSEKYSYVLTVGYTKSSFENAFFRQLPYAAAIIIIISIFIVLLLHLSVNFRRSIKSDIQRGINNREFHAYYQPIVNSKSGQWIGAELLVRWLHPKHDVISPAEFIHTAESTGLIKTITLHLLERAAYEKTRIQAENNNSYISINVTASMIINPRYVTELISIILKYPSLQHNVVFEFTERETFSSTELAELKLGMQRLREVGIKWALDDFGTGYAGLSTLQSLRFDILKIDRTFVASSVTDAVTHSILDNIAEMGHTLHCTMIAEGVETAEQAEYVDDLGIEASQGFFYAKPMPFEDYLNELSKPAPTSQPEKLAANT